MFTYADFYAILVMVIPSILIANILRHHVILIERLHIWMSYFEGGIVEIGMVVFDMGRTSITLACVVRKKDLEKL
ncbi:hypothetical protein OAU04_03790 [Alphaproteobacteria bacterium]|nr:hypothetical protein [Alphaproteobacteria bacterium]